MSEEREDPALPTRGMRRQDETPEDARGEVLRRTRGLRIACASALVLFATSVVVIAAIYPILNGLSSKATCRNCLRVIGVACHMYADDHDEEFPPGFRELFPTYIDNARVFKCPTGEAAWEDFDGGTIRETSSSYTYVPGSNAWMPGHLLLAYERSDKNHGWAGRHVLYIDASVEWYPAAREAELQDKLKKQREALGKWRAAGAKKEDIEKFFVKPGATK